MRHPMMNLPVQNMPIFKALDSTLPGAFRKAERGYQIGHLQTLYFYLPGLSRDASPLSASRLNPLHSVCVRAYQHGHVCSFC